MSSVRVSGKSMSGRSVFSVRVSGKSVSGEWVSSERVSSEKTSDDWVSSEKVSGKSMSSERVSSQPVSGNSASCISAASGSSADKSRPSGSFGSCSSRRTGGRGRSAAARVGLLSIRWRDCGWYCSLGSRGHSSPSPMSAPRWANTRTSTRYQSGPPLSSCADDTSGHSRQASIAKNLTMTCSAARVKATHRGVRQQGRLCPSVM